MSPVNVPLRRTRRWLFAGLVGATTLTATAMMHGIVRAGGVAVLELAILAFFIPTFGWISVAFWNASIGFLLQMLRVDPNRLVRLDTLPRTDAPVRGRTAIVVPARHEDPELVLGGIAAVAGSLEGTGQAEHFDIHLLSDSTDPGWAETEEAAWLALLGRVPRPDRLHYRRRAENTGHKAGNIAEFLISSGHAYDFMVVLDADSVMSGDSLVALVRAIEADPEAGLVQTVPIPARQKTLFGRLVQFAAALYSPMLATGQAFWQTDSANYWGHNAIIRVRPFMEHCRLPTLPGRPPLGGAVLSHDFVEAALLRRAGWRVWLEPCLGGSYEQVPANVPDFAKRDRRWAVGSLQHLRLLREPGLAGLSRVHFVFGAMGYVSSVLWLLLLLAGTTYVVLPSASLRAMHGVDAAWISGWSERLHALLPLLFLTAVVLFVPKVLGLTSALVRRPADFGGRARLLVGGLAEALFAVLVAPLMMMYHAAFVLSTLAGQNVVWGTQARTGRTLGWREAMRRTAPITATGAVWASGTLYVSPAFFLWLTPIFAGLLLAAPIARWTSDAKLGRRLRALGLLLVPSETRTPPELRAPDRHVSTESDMLITVDAHGVRTDASSAPMYQIERALFELRQGRPLLLTLAQGQGDDTPLLLAAVEGVDAPKLEELRRLGTGDPRLVITSLRAGALGIHVPGGFEQATGVSLHVNGERPVELLSLAAALEEADTSRMDARLASSGEAAALALIRRTGLVPAALTIGAHPDESAELTAALDSGAVLSIGIDAVLSAQQGGAGIEITHVSDARVPLADAEDARFMLFREAGGLVEHVAVLVGDPEEWPSVVPVRLHSACLTGDLFGSLRCDCGEQLHRSMRYFSEHGGGVLLYLQQEGRGIGLGNKLRAYALQEQGLDTVDADRVLGFGADERRYDAAVRMLLHLGIEQVKLLTNNPEKVRAIESGGIRVTERQPLHGTLNDHNLRYVRAKVHRAGHWLHEMLYGAFPGAPPSGRDGRPAGPS